MEEVQVQPRDIYLHYVHVDKPGQTLLWSFSTKRKNISFGLYRRKGISVSSSDTYVSTTKSVAKTIHTHGPRTSNASSTVGLVPSGATLRPTLGRPQSHSSIHSTNSDSDNDTIPSTDIQDTHISTKSEAQLRMAARNQRKASSGSLTLKDPDLVEILPIQKYASATSTIKGQHVVSEAGTYVLVFDNSFSIQTPKQLTFFVAVNKKGVETRQQTDIDISGWMLKKKRKRMQGWAKRWIQLSNIGVLSYKLRPDEISRGSIQIVLSTISASVKTRMIHIDTGTTTYHLKALTEEDFERWMKALRKYKTNLVPQQYVGSDDGLDADDTEPVLIDRVSSLLPTRENPHQIRDIRTSLGEWSAYIDKLEGLYQVLQHSAFKTTLPGENASIKASSSKFRLGFRKVPSSTSTTTYNAGSTISPPNVPEGSDYMSAGSTPSTPDDVLEQFNTALRALKQLQRRTEEQVNSELQFSEQLEQACQALQVEVVDLRMQRSRPTSQRGSFRLAGSGSDRDLHNLREELGEDDGFSRNRDSMSSLQASYNSDVFFDAQDITLTDESGDEEEDEAMFEAALDGEESDSSNSDEGRSRSPPPKELRQMQSMASLRPTDKEGPVHLGMVLSRMASPPRRSVLPAQVSGDEVSLFSILRKNVGKDLSTIAMPISMNEPINLLQRLCEELEYSDLLDRANACENSLDRLIYVATFAMSAFASTQGRVTRKPFNPILGETYECIRPDKGFRFFAEKVSHHPPVMACHAESQNFVFWQDSKVKTKFWGKSAELTSLGQVHVNLPKYGDSFSYNKPSTWMRNMMVGTKYLEHIGEVRVVNHTTGEYALLVFKEAVSSGLFSSSGGNGHNEVTGTIFDAAGRKQRVLQGKWNEAMTEQVAKDQFRVLWRANPPRPNQQKYYGFTQFTTELNEITSLERGHLPPTDTRFRPDQRLFEEGKVTEAEAEKLRVEQAQRDRRKDLEEAGQTYQPVWFARTEDGPGSGEHAGMGWTFKGTYWDAHDKGHWPQLLPLW